MHFHLTSWTTHVSLDPDSVTMPPPELPLELLLMIAHHIRDDNVFSPMHAARSAEMMQLLLDHNADPDFRELRGLRPLHWYAFRHDIAAMRALLQHGAEVNPDTGYEMPLNIAVKHHLDTVELLVEHGADVRGRDFKGNTPLHLAAAARKIDVVKFLVEQWPEAKEALNNDGKTPLSSFEQEWRFYLSMGGVYLVTKRRRRLLLCWAARTLRPITIEDSSQNHSYSFNNGGTPNYYISIVCAHCARLRKRLEAHIRLCYKMRRQVHIFPAKRIKKMASGFDGSPGHLIGTRRTRRKTN
jgi:ankyrin repeat protein